LNLVSEIKCGRDKAELIFTNVLGKLVHQLKLFSVLDPLTTVIENEKKANMEMKRNIYIYHYIH